MRSSAIVVAAAVLAVFSAPALSNEAILYEEIVVQADPYGTIVYEDAYGNATQDVDAYATAGEIVYGEAEGTVIHSESYATGEAEYIEVPESAVIFIEDATVTVEGTVQSY